MRSLNSLSPLLLASVRTLTNSRNGTNSLSVAQHLGPKRSRLPRLHLQPPSSSSSATGVPKSPSLYASPRIPLHRSVSVSANQQQGWETLQDGTAQPVSSEPLSVQETAADADVLLPRPSRALEAAQRRVMSERSTRIPEKRKTATAEQRSVSQPPAARVRPPAARDNSSQIPPTSSSSRPRLVTATDLPSRLPTPRRRVPSQGPTRSFSARTGTREDPAKHVVTPTELELEEIVRPQTAAANRATSTASSSGRDRPFKGEDPAIAAAAAAAAAARRLPPRPATTRMSTSRRTVSTSRMRTKSAPWPTTRGDGGGERNEPLPPWFDDSGPRIYRSSEGELTFAGADSGPSPSSSAAVSLTSSLPLRHHRPQDRVVPAVAKRIEAERLKQLQADDPGLGHAWLVSEWGVTGDPRRAVSVPMKSFKLAEHVDHSKQQRESSSITAVDADIAVPPELSLRGADYSNSEPTEAVATQPDPPEPPDGDRFDVASEERTTTTSSSSSPPPRHPSEAPNSRSRATLVEHEQSRHGDDEQVISAARAASDHHQTVRSQIGRLGRGSSPNPGSVAAVGRADPRHSCSSVVNGADEEARISDLKSPGCCASCVIS